jgi:hypothetical protein
MRQKLSIEMHVDARESRSDWFSTNLGLIALSSLARVTIHDNSKEFHTLLVVRTENLSSVLLSQCGETFL